MLATHEQIRETLKKSKHVLLTARADTHVDSVSSCLSFYQLLKKMGVQADIVIASPDHVVQSVHFLPSASDIKVGTHHFKHLVIKLSRPGAKVGNFRYAVEGNTLNIYITPAEGQFEPGDVKAETGMPAYDLVVTLDTPDLPSLGALYTDHADFFLRTPIINIDHNPGNEQYGQINHIDIRSVSTTEVLFQLFKDIGDDHVDADLATTLLAGMIAKTQSFKTPTVTPRALMLASELVQRGARRDEIIQHLYRQHDLPTLRLWGRVLARLQSDEKRKFVWSVVKREDFEKSGADIEKLPGMINELISTAPQAKTVALVFENADGKIATWLKTEAHTDARELTRKWNPVGTKTLVNFTFPSGNIDEALKEVQAVVETIPIGAAQ